MAVELRQTAAARAHCCASLAFLGVPRLHWLCPRISAVLPAWRSTLHPQPSWRLAGPAVETSEKSPRSHTFRTQSSCPIACLKARLGPRTPDRLRQHQRVPPDPAAERRRPRPAITPQRLLQPCGSCLRRAFSFLACYSETRHPAGWWRTPATDPH